MTTQKEDLTPRDISFNYWGHIWSGLIDLAQESCDIANSASEAQTHFDANCGLATGASTFSFIEERADQTNI